MAISARERIAALEISLRAEREALERSIRAENFAAAEINWQRIKVAELRLSSAVAAENN
jgi:hypothetical protein